MRIQFFAVLFLLVLLVSLTACGDLTPAPTPTLKPQESLGKELFKSYCSSCHETSYDTVIVGPSLAGIATRGNQRVQGMDAAMYIRDSVINPAAFTVEGFTEGLMPSTMKDQMTEEELDALIAYLLTLK